MESATILTPLEPDSCFQQPQEKVFPAFNHAA